LLISIHRHDRGSFYPAGDYGSLSSNGKGKGEGTKINIPLHHVDKNFKTYNLQGAGDN
jgi:acetoin utilization deacetylase AcuC-like enzyme